MITELRFKLADLFEWLSNWIEPKGFLRLRYKGIPIVKDEACDSQTMYFLNEKQLSWKQHLRKDGKPDMRFRRNHPERLHTWESK